MQHPTSPRGPGRGHHPALDSLAFLLGTWQGEGRGEFPTVEPFRYEEEISFSHVGGPFLVYSQRAWSPEDGTVLHSELGFWRPAPEHRLDVALAHPLGLVEITEGTISGTTIRLWSAVIGRASTGSPTTRLDRRYEVEDDVLSYEVDMATFEVPLSRHLVARLRRRREP